MYHQNLCTNMGTILHNHRDDSIICHIGGRVFPFARRRIFW